MTTALLRAAVVLLAAITVLAGASADLPGYRDLHQRYAAAVVGLTCTATWNGSEGGFYGTGVVLSADGLILTNITVVPADARDIRVHFVDGRVLDATLEATDRESEGVLLEVAADGLVAMPIADSDAYRIGDPVFAWGNAGFSIQQDGMVTLRQGTISGIYDVASVDDQSRYRGPVIESDAVINGGADGGPLTDMDGNLVALQSLAYARTRWLGCSIPTARLRAALPRLAALALASRPPLEGERAREWPEHALAERVYERFGDAVVAVAVRHRGRPPLPVRRPQVAPPRAPLERDPARLTAAERTRSADDWASGVVVVADGRVVTSRSALGDLETIEEIGVYPADGRLRSARLLGHSEADDLALLAIDLAEGERLASLEPGPDDLAVGEMVVVLGRSEAPGRPTMNLGRVSALRRLRGSAWQVEAAVNHGNLGGPVLGLDGRLVGVAAHLDGNTPWRQNCGVGFVVRSHRLAEILPVLEAGETVPRPQRPFIGFRPEPFAGHEPGIGIAAVIPGTPAATAGLVAGDRLVAFAGEDFSGWFHFLDLLDQRRPGEEVVIGVLRGGERLDLELTLAARDD